MVIEFIELFTELALVYLLLTIACSEAIEWLYQRSGARRKYMRRGLLDLLQEDRWFYLRTIKHPTVAVLFHEMPGRGVQPSYVPPESFATALLDVVVNKARRLDPSFRHAPTMPQTAQDLAAAAGICADFGFPVGYIVLPLVANAASFEDAKAEVSKWYEKGMEHRSQSYKATTQKRLVLFGFMVAAVFNIDSITIGKALLHSAIANHEAPITPDVASQASQLPKDLPLLYGCLSANDESASIAGIRETASACYTALRAESWLVLFLRILGWFITAFAISFGAQFWFDLLKLIVSFRGASTKPSAT